MKKIKIKVAFKDHRGTISDIFYNKDIQHVAIIKSPRNKIRGNHYHKKTTQYMLVIKGKMEYWYRDLNKKSKPKKILINEGEMVETPPYEIHGLKTLTKNEFIVFSIGKRGGKDYETDTFRMDDILIK